MNTIPNESTCPKCGKPVSLHAFEGLCPECLMQAGFGTVTGDPGEKKISAFVPPTPEELARHFPQLEILELLGRGGMGAVYKARQTHLDRIVALKILPPSVSRAPFFAERFVREAKALAKLHHPNIVTLYESGQADELFYFLMEFVDGMNLRQLLAAGTISPKDALAIVPQICDALQFAHDRGIVHRDIKPENILLSKAGQVKIADFGVAKIVAGELPESPSSGAASAEGSQTEAGKVIGTPQYMAPEQISHPLDVDNRADIYALGVVFYQMLTGELPLGKFEPPSRKVQIDVRLDEVVLRALEKEPGMRYQQASVMKTQVETIAESGFTGGESTEVPAPPTPLLRTAESLYATPEYLATIWGTMKLHENAAILRLYNDRLEINLKWRNIVIPLRELSRLQVVSYPRLLNLRGLHAIEIEFTEASLQRRLLLTPSLNRLSISKQGVDEWFDLLRSTIITATGKPPAGSATPVPYQGFSSDGLFWAKSMMIGAFLVGVAILLLVFSSLWVAGVASWPGLLKHWAIFVILPIMIGVAFVFIRRIWPRANKPELRYQQDSGRQNAKIEPRFSRTAIVGAGCLLLALGVPFVGIFARYELVRGQLASESFQRFQEVQAQIQHHVIETDGNLHSSASTSDLVQPFRAPLAGVFYVGLFFLEPVLLIAATIFGWIAVSQIRRSEGKLYGMWLAVFDGLLFPLLALDGAVVAMLLLALWCLYSASGGMKLFVSIFGLALVVFGIIALVDFLIIRAVWRSVNKLPGQLPAAAPGVAPGSASGRTDAPRFSRMVIMGVVFALFLLTVLSSEFASARQSAWALNLFAVLGIGSLLFSRLWWAANPTRLNKKTIWGPCAVFSAILFINLCQWLKNYEPEGVWIPNAVDASVSGEYGEALIHVTDVSQSGQVVLIKLVCDTPDPGRGLHVQYSGQIFDYPADVGLSATNVDCLVAPSFMSGNDKVLAGTTLLKGKPVYQIGFILPDAATAAKVVEQVKQVHLGKPRGLDQNKSSLLLFSLHRYVGQKASGEPFHEGLDGMLVWQPKQNSTANSSVAETSRSGPNVVRQVKDARFVASLSQGEVELVAVGNQPWKDPVCWLPNGQPSAEPFPTGNADMSNSAENMESKKFAFTIRNESAEGISCPICRFSKDSGAQPGSSSWVAPDKRTPDGRFGQIIVYPKGASTMNISLGVANGAWETAITFNHENNNTSGGAMDGDWSATWQAVTGKEGDMAVSCSYNKNEDWESRMVYVDDTGQVIPIQENSTHVGNGQTGATLLVSSNEFAHIKEFRLQRRKYQWVEFRNVSLQSGSLTTVEVKDSATQNFSFGPVMERVVTAFDENPAQACLNLGSGEFRPPPAALADRIRPIADKEGGAPFTDLGAPGNEPYDWLKTSGVDLIGCRGADGGLRFKYIGQPPHYYQGGWTGFDTVSPNEVVQTLQSSPFFAGDEPNRPDVYINSMNPNDEATKEASYILFRTHDGDVGVIKVLGTSENPPGVKIRYKLVQSSVTTVTPVNLPPATAQNPIATNVPVAAFGPVMEHVLPMDKNGLASLFDLDHNKLVPDPGPGNTTAGLAEIFSSGLVVSHDEAKGQTVLIGMAAGTATKSVPPEQWETMSAAEAMAAVDKNPGKSGWGVMTASLAIGKPPLTFLFKTPSGKVGLWQVEEFTEHPRGVKIRYKLAQIPIATH